MNRILPTALISLALNVVFLGDIAKGQLRLPSAGDVIKPIEQGVRDTGREISRINPRNPENIYGLPHNSPNNNTSRFAVQSYEIDQDGNVVEVSPYGNRRILAKAQLLRDNTGRAFWWSQQYNLRAWATPYWQNVLDQRDAAARQEAYQRQQTQMAMERQRQAAIMEQQRKERQEQQVVQGVQLGLQLLGQEMQRQRDLELQRENELRRQHALQAQRLRAQSDQQRQDQNGYQPTQFVQNSGEPYANNLGAYYTPVRYQDGTMGARVTRTSPGSPAAALQLEPGDAIIAMDNMRFTNHQDVLNHRALTTVTFVNIRTGQAETRVVNIP